MNQNEKNYNQAKTFRLGFVASLPVMAGYVVLGIAFGILMYDKGYNWLWVLLMSVFIFAGSMQFVGAELLATAASPLSAAVMTLMVNARHIFYGISMIEPYRKAGKFKPYLIFALTDETYSLVCSPNLEEDVDPIRYSFWVSLLDHFWWVLGSLIGSLLGSVIPFDTTGVDFAMTALFVTIFVDQWEKAPTHIPALIGLGSAVVCLFIFGSGSFLLPTMVCIPIGLFAFKKQIQSAGGAQQ